MYQWKVMIKFQLNLIVCIFALIYAGCLSAEAETAIKSTDQEGNVTYSDKAAADAVSSTEIEIETGPTESQVKEAELRAKTTMEQADQAQAERDALARQKEAEREAAAEHNSAQSPETIVIGNESRHPVNNPPPGSNPPLPIPPGNGGSQHPIYTPPATNPPIANPLPSPK